MPIYNPIWSQLLTIVLSQFQVLKLYLDYFQLIYLSSHLLV